jgi:aminopeptidase N
MNHCTTHTKTQIIRRIDYKPAPFLIDQITMQLKLASETTRIEAELSIRRNPSAPTTDRETTLKLDGIGLQLIAVRLNNTLLNETQYHITPQQLIIHQVPDQFLLHTTVHIHPETNALLEGLYVSEGLLCTQCEAEGFRRITYYLDRPDNLARYTVTLIADPHLYPILLANGNLVKRQTLADGRQAVTWHDPFPKPCYLFAVVAGRLACVADQFITCSGRPVTIHFYVEPGQESLCQHALWALKQAMRWDEQQYGREYDLDLFMIVAVSHFNSGAMENKGLNLFNAKYVLASLETATDDNFADITSVIAHEYFHNWTGNRITCRDWFQLSLKEGLTVYRDQEFSATQRSAAVQRIHDVRYLRTRQFPEDHGPFAHPVRPESYLEISNFYTTTIYEKGAELIRMQARLLGSVAFRAAMDLYFTRYDGKAVTIDDFVACMEEAGQCDLTQFKRWYSQAGTPHVTCHDDWEPTTGRYTLHFQQTIPITPQQPQPQPVPIPIAIGLLDAQGNEQPIPAPVDAPPSTAAQTIFVLRHHQDSFSCTGLTQRPIPSLLRGFSAPVHIDYPYTSKQLLLLMIADTDGFNRWQAAQTLTQRHIMSALQTPLTALDDLVAAFRQILCDDQLSPALRAEILTLPSESWLGEQMEIIDIDGLHHAREQLIAALAHHLRDDLLMVYQKSSSQTPHHYTPETSGQRALINRCLDYLIRIPDTAIVELCHQQFASADNMTLCSAALAALLQLSDHPHQPWQTLATEALTQFYERWAKVPLVIDHWFTLQAQACLPTTAARVQTLTQHPDFSVHNPNRVRSLIGAFSLNNPFCFHQADGTGYRLLTNWIIVLNHHNPRIAARLMQPLIHWQRHEPGRQHLMREQLQRIRHEQGLSNDVYEVLSKAGVE